jgi:hypothetical protein
LPGGETGLSPGGGLDVAVLAQQEQVHTVGRPQADLLDGLARQVALDRHGHSRHVVGEVPGVDELLLRARFVVSTLAPRQHDRAQDQEIEDAGGKQCEPHRRHCEEAEGGLPSLPQDVVEDDEGARGHHGQSAAEDGGESDRHEQS